MKSHEWIMLIRLGGLNPFRSRISASVLLRSVIRKGIVGAALLVFPGAYALAAWTEGTLISFDGADGNLPNPGLIADAAGNLYGTTFSGGASNEGAVFELSPPGVGQTVWTEQLLASFSPTDGDFPEAGLVFDGHGNLFGTTDLDGKHHNGRVFELIKPAEGKTAWTEKTVFSFNGKDGTIPHGQLVFDAAGNLYGTTQAGGANGWGSVFELTPPAAGKTDWAETTLLSFDATDGAIPLAGVIVSADGNLFGTTEGGGKYGVGTVFELIAPSIGETTWTEKTLVSFDGAGGSFPFGGLIADATGVLYGTTNQGGRYGYGTVFELSPPAEGKTAWSRKTLISFKGTDGEYPNANVTADAAGNLYGTTYRGGAYGVGTVFKLTPPGPGKSVWTERTLVSLNGNKGDYAASGLIFDPSGNLYGTTGSGGASGDGAVIQVKP